MSDPVTTELHANPRRGRRIGVFVAITLLATALDAPAGGFFRGLSLGGDLRRELEFVQQFGAVTSCLLIAATIWLLDPAKRAALPRAAAAILATSASVWVLKVLIGRPRPRLGEPHLLLGPWSDHTFEKGGTQVTLHAWEFWKSPSDLWSMPSSHTSAACALACVLAHLYPKLTPLLVTLVCLVGTSRVVLGAHYPSDVCIGAALGWLVAGGVMARGRVRA